MDVRTRYEKKLAEAEEQLETLLQSEQRMMEKCGHGFRHPFYTRKINKLYDRIYWLQEQLDKMTVEAGR